jgi:hypothetical protein
MWIILITIKINSTTKAYDLKRVSAFLAGSCAVVAP